MKVSQKTVSGIESGGSDLGIAHQIKLCKIFGVTHDYLITGLKTDSILDELCKNISISYQTMSIGENSYETPQLSINRSLFNYLMVCARINNDKQMPENIKEQWKSQEREKFYNNLTNADFVKIVPLPEQMIMPDENKKEWKQADLIRELNTKLNKYQQATDDNT